MVRKIVYCEKKKRDVFRSVNKIFNDNSNCYFQTYLKQRSRAKHRFHTRTLPLSSASFGRLGSENSIYIYLNLESRAKHRFHTRTLPLSAALL